MNKTYAILAIAVASASLMPSVHADDLTGWFVNAGAGRANYHATVAQYDLGSEHGSAGIVNFGYRTQFIGFEAGYTNLGSVTGTVPDMVRGKLSGDGWTAGINGHFNLGSPWYISARAGFFMWKLHATLTDYTVDPSETYKASRQSLDGYAGVGFGYDFTRSWSVGVAFDYYRISKSHDEIGHLDIGSRVWTLNAEYRF
jgi:opacity protein-like surface antigen